MRRGSVRSIGAFLALLVTTSAAAADSAVPPLSLDAGVQGAFEVALNFIRQERRIQLQWKPDQDQVAFACLGVSATGVEPDKPKGVLHADWWLKPDKLQDPDLLTARKEWRPEAHIRVILMPDSQCPLRNDKMLGDPDRPYRLFVGTQSVFEGLRKYATKSQTVGIHASTDVETEGQYLGIFDDDNGVQRAYLWFRIEDGELVVTSGYATGF